MSVASGAWRARLTPAVFLLVLVGIAPWARADLPSDGQYVATHVALAKACRAFGPDDQPRYQRGEAVMLCDLTEGTIDRRSLYARLLKSPRYEALLADYESRLKKETPETMKGICKQIAAYPLKGQYCEWVEDADGSPGKAIARDFAP